MTTDPTTRVTQTDQRTFRRSMARKRPCLIQYTGDALGRRFLIDAAETTLGRAPGNGFVILDDSVSRTHVTCRLIHETVEIEDLHSRNGTFVNDLRLALLNEADRRLYESKRSGRNRVTG